ARPRRLLPPRGPAGGARAPPCEGQRRRASRAGAGGGQDGSPHGAELLGRRLGTAVPAPGVANRHGDVPVLISEDIVISQPAKILNFLRKQKYNADYELSAKQGADTLAYIALLEEKLLPALLHTFWVEAENYCSVTKPWFASRIAFPLSLYLPGRMSREALNRILLTRGGPPLYSLTEVEAQIYRDAKECLNLLSKRLGTSQFFFGDTPTTLDAFVFGFLAPIYKVCFPRVQLQEHLKQLPNLCRFCDDILTCYFRLTVLGFAYFNEIKTQAIYDYLRAVLQRTCMLHMGRGRSNAAAV
uniref:Metaxin 3 n=1 Tax=Falco tinnunculus TaxID=100819 RepID=A0A8C4VB62_FALTI